MASSSYQILINETPVDLGDSGTPLDRPCFKNTLSSGDKRTLALVFFLAQLDRDPEKASKIVVFDDPFSSQDRFRKAWTVQQIVKRSETCRQVIVLSHDETFLRRIWDRLGPRAADRKSLQLARIGLTNTKICEWDVEQATRGRFLEDLDALSDFYTTGEGVPREIVNKIRPVLETHCRNLCPGEFVGDSLGEIVGHVRSAGAGHQLFPLIEKLEAINDYARRTHHGESPGAATEPINATELQGFARRTLEIVGTC